MSISLGPEQVEKSCSIDTSYMVADTFPFEYIQTQRKLKYGYHDNAPIKVNGIILEHIMVQVLSCLQSRVV